GRGLDEHAYGETALGQAGDPGYGNLFQHFSRQFRVVHQILESQLELRNRFIDIFAVRDVVFAIVIAIVARVVGQLVYGRERDQVVAAIKRAYDDRAYGD